MPQGMKRKYLCSFLLTAALLSGCESRGLPDETRTSAESTNTSAEPSVDEHFSEHSGETVSASRVTEETAEKEIEVTDPTMGTYDMPPEFYDRLYDIVGGFVHFNYYDISLAYCDLETGFRIMLNPDTHYYSASVIKAPYMLYIYRLALAGKADLEQKLTYTEKYRREGTGVLKNMEYETEFTVEELIGYCLEESDNSAFAMLKELFPEDGYEQFAASLGGVHAEDAKAKGGPQICCESALTFSRVIYDFIEEKNPYSENLYTHMTNSRNAMIYGGDGSEVIRKYGWYDGFFHDMAIVYGKKRYLLTIMTNFDLLEIDSREYGIFKDLSLLFAEYSASVCETENGGDTVIIKMPKWEENEMILPKDPYMLLSVVNMKLRDSYKSFDDFCEDMDVSSAEISEPLGKIGYVYSTKLNQFAPVPEPESTASESVLKE
ncbi:MAG: serine hydrolase [Oscillospiraceae bacterium]|nr:serine hydrolase [Oscillospiraceae bacterium]